MKNTGIWLDKEKALIIKLNNDKEDIVTIESNIEQFSIKSNKEAGGPNETASDSKFLEREKNQFKKFFKSIIPEINQSECKFLA